MGLNETTRHLRELLAGISVDLEKAAGGNKAASQRVRTSTIKLEKTAKMYRKESIHAEKAGTGPKRASQQKKAQKAQKPSKQAKLKAKPKAKAVFNPKKSPAAKKPASKFSARR